MRKANSTSLDCFFRNFQSISYPKKTTIIQPGDNPQSVYYLKSGFIRMYAISQEGQELTIHIHENGAVFPMSWVLNDEVNEFTYETMTTSKLYLSPKPDVLLFFKNEPEILLDLSKRLLAGIGGMAFRMETIIFGSARVRIISILLYLAKHFGKKTSDGVMLTYIFTHQDISHLTGLSREKVSLEMEKLTREKMICIKNHHLILNNIVKLKYEVQII